MTVRPFCTVVVALLLSLPAASGASDVGTRDSYVRQWTLDRERDDAAAYRVTLTPAVYETIHRADARDLQVFNAAGEAIPTGLVTPAETTTEAAAQSSLPWFELPLEQTTRQTDLSLLSRTGDGGQILQIETRHGTPGTAGVALLIDASALERPIERLRFVWHGAQSSLDLGYRLEGSDDLRDWQTIDARVQLVDLQRDGRRLVRNEVEVSTAHRYLRLVPLQPRPGPIFDTVIATQAQTATPAPREWLALEGRVAEGLEGIWFEYTLPGRYPIDQVDVDASTSNAIGTWTLRVRDGETDAWRTLIDQWTVWQVQDGDERSRSAPLVLRNVNRQRIWRLQATDPGTSRAAPTLRLGYRAERVAFVAQGDAPYALAAGSARSERVDSPIFTLLEAQREQHGDDWTPAGARLGAIEVLAGDAALQPAPDAIDWTRWLLWLLLGGAAAFVGFLAVSLLRRTPQA